MKDRFFGGISHGTGASDGNAFWLGYGKEFYRHHHYVCLGSAVLFSTPPSQPLNMAAKKEKSLPDISGNKKKEFA